MFDKDDVEGDMFAFLLAAFRFAIGRYPEFAMVPVLHTPEGGVEHQSTVGAMLAEIERYLDEDEEYGGVTH